MKLENVVPWGRNLGNIISIDPIYQFIKYEIQQRTETGKYLYDISKITLL